MIGSRVNFCMSYWIFRVLDSVIKWRTKLYCHMSQNTKIDWRQPQLKNQELTKKVLQILYQKPQQNLIFFDSILPPHTGANASLHLCPSPYHYIIDVLKKDQTNRIFIKTVCFLRIPLEISQIGLVEFVSNNQSIIIFYFT